MSTRFRKFLGLTLLLVGLVWFGVELLSLSDPTAAQLAVDLFGTPPSRASSLVSAVVGFCVALLGGWVAFRSSNAGSRWL